MAAFMAVCFALFFAVLLFIICRQFVLWYFRVNEAVDTLKSIESKLAALAPAPKVEEAN